MPLVQSPTSVRLLLAALAFAAVAFGALAGLAPMAAVGGALAVAFALLVVNDLAFGVCVFAVVTFSEALPSLEGGLLTPAKAIGALLVISWLATIAAGRARGRDLVQTHPVYSAALVLMVAWVALSALWAGDPTATMTVASTWALNLLLVPIVFTAIRERRHLEAVFAILAVGTLLSAALGVVAPGGGGEALEGGGRLAGAGINPNQLGGLLIIGTVFAVALAARRGLAVSTRIAWLLVAVGTTAALAFTLSRGALVGLAVCVLVTPVLIGPRRRLPSLVAGVTGLVVIVLATLAFVPSAEVARLTDDSSGSGRTDLWAVGLRMVEANPVLGVGAGNYELQSIRYLVEPGLISDSRYIADEPKVPHNIYLQAAAELGLPGMVLFLFVVGFAVWCAARAALTFRLTGRHSEEMLARGLLIAMIGFLAFEFFSSQMYSKALYLLLALGPATLALARRQADDA